MEIKPVPSNRSDDEIDARAQQVYDAVSSDLSINGMALNVSALAEKLGGKIRLPELEQLGESMEVRSASDFTIFLPPFSSPKRDRFTIAHELGHYFLHYPWWATDPPQITFNRPSPVPSESYSYDKMEAQANRFAAALLMPERLFRKTFQDAEGNVDSLSRIWNVSVPSIKIRCRVLRLGLSA